MEYLYFLSLTFSRFDKKWYMVVAAVFFAALIIGIILVKRGKLTFPKMAAYVLFAGYLVLVLLGTVISREQQEPFRLRIDLIESWKLIFAGDFATQIETLSNIILFIPFGVLLPFCLGKNYRLGQVFSIALLGTLFLTTFIESVQYVSGYGLFETADIINNLFGSIVGIVFFVVIKWLKDRIIFRKKHKAGGQ